MGDAQQVSAEEAAKLVERDGAKRKPRKSRPRKQSSRPTYVAPIDPVGAEDDAAELEAAENAAHADAELEANASAEPGAEPGPTPGQTVEVPRAPYTVGDATRDVRDVTKAFLLIPALIFRARQGREIDMSRLNGTAERVARAAAPRVLGRSEGFFFWGGMVAAGFCDVLEDVIDKVTKDARERQAREVSGAAIVRQAQQPNPTTGAST